MLNLVHIIPGFVIAINIFKRSSILLKITIDIGLLLINNFNINSIKVMSILKITVDF